MERKVICNVTDEEVAKSFIEDVEQVKEQLPRDNTIIIPKDATNGDVIKAIFPGCRPIEGTLLIDTDIAVFEPDWWNAPYKGSEE